MPGGHLDEGETWEEAGIREAKEELDVDIKLEELFVEEYNEDLDKEERFYFASVEKGKIKKGSGEEYKNMDIDSKYGLYEIVKINRNEMSAYNILPITVKDKLIAVYV